MKFGGSCWAQIGWLRGKVAGSGRESAPFFLTWSPPRYTAIRKERVPSQIPCLEGIAGCDKLSDLPVLNFSSTLLELFRGFFLTFKFRNGERRLGPRLVQCGLLQGELRFALRWR